jgi:hypothetical protein
MKKHLVVLMAMVLVLAIALPVFALDVKYGGLFRARFQNNNNFTDANNDNDDNQTYFDQRLRWFATFIASENLQLVTGFEVDTLWGDSRGSTYPAGTLNSVGGAKVLTGHRDTVNIEVKHAYVDFMIPDSTVRAKVGLQPLNLMKGWIVDEDFTAAVALAKFEPVTVSLGYISEVNNDVTDFADNVDDFFLSVDYAEGPFKAGIMGFYQYAHDQLDARGNAKTFAAPRVGRGNSDNLIDLGAYFGYKADWWDVALNYVQNLGSYDNALDESQDYNGFMFEAYANAYVSDFTFTLGGFVTSGDSAPLNSGNSVYAYPIGKSHYWSEIMGLGSLETTVNNSGTARASDPATVGYTADDFPSNLWTVNLGAAWQALPTTKLTANYYYIATTKSVAATPVFNRAGAIVDFDNETEVGHELDFYLDQTIVDKLTLRLVGAYLFAGDAISPNEEDDDLYELGARLQWAF